MPKKYLNKLELHTHAVGNEHRLDILKEVLENGTFLPRTVEYKDIDLSFMEWVKSLTMISDEGKEYPTISLFSNQRFSEYSQSWHHLDENNNLLLNFKAVTRENNPQLGKIQNDNWNIPGDRFYTMKKQRALDNNGTESFLVLKMKQPVAIDMMFKVSIFTTKYADINTFNIKINKLFAARQCYISPNGHFMPMTLENISDESKYNIDDRQFYSQTYQIKVMAYIITEEDYKVEEIPLKIGGNLGFSVKRKKADVEIEEFLCEPSPAGKYYYKPIEVTIKFPDCVEKTKFTLDTHFTITNINIDKKISKISFFVNDEEVSIKEVSEENPVIIQKFDEIKILISKKLYNEEDTIVILSGFNPMVVYSEDLDDMESILDEYQESDEYEINVE